MIRVHIGDHGQNGHQAEKGTIGFVGLGDEIFAFAPSRALDPYALRRPPMITVGSRFAAWSKIEASKRGRGGLAVGPGNGHAGTARRINSASISALRYNWDIPLNRALPQLGVVLGDGRGFHHNLRIRHIARAVTDETISAPRLAQVLDHRGIGSYPNQLTAYFRFRSTSAIPLMPEPPIPTIWIFLIRPFMSDTTFNSRSCGLCRAIASEFPPDSRPPRQRPWACPDALIYLASAMDPQSVRRPAAIGSMSPAKSFSGSSLCSTHRAAPASAP